MKGITNANNLSGGIPETYIKSAAISGNTLSLYDENDDKIDFTPTTIPTIINTVASNVTLQLANKTSHRYSQTFLSSLTISFQQYLSEDFESEIVFKSGSTATTFSQGSEVIKWSGDDVSNNTFTPAANKTYNILFWYDGVNRNAVVRGV